jgi:hypothetical protein
MVDICGAFAMLARGGMVGGWDDDTHATALSVIWLLGRRRWCRAGGRGYCVRCGRFRSGGVAVERGAGKVAVTVTLVWSRAVVG